MDGIAIRLLGLEPECYERAGDSERMLIRWVMYSFMSVLLSSLIATYIIGLFVSGSYLLAILISFMGTFVMISIFRFSLILIKPRIMLMDQLKENLTSTWKEKWQKIKNWFKKGQEIATDPGSVLSKPIPGFTTIFRLTYLVMLACVLIFPLCVVLNWKAAMQYNQQLRQEALEEYRISERVFGAHKGSISDSNEMQRRMAWYEDKVSNEYFTMALFVRAKHYDNFWLVSAFVLFFLFLPHWLLFRWMRNNSYSYVSTFNTYIKELIISDLQQLKKEAEAIVEKKNSRKMAIDLGFLTSGDPYKPSQITIPKKKNISWKEWQKKLEPQQIVAKPVEQP